MEVDAKIRLFDDDGLILRGKEGSSFFEQQLQPQTKKEGVFGVTSPKPKIQNKQKMEP